MIYKNISCSAPTECSGCGACAAVCPSGAVTFDVSGGYRLATVDSELCTGCGACLKVCHRFGAVDSEPSIYDAAAVYCGYSTVKDVLKTSSSGGAAYELARFCILQGYEVIGACYDLHTDRVKHIIVSSCGELPLISGSKYLPSDTSEALARIQKGHKYLFIGTPCQVYGARMLARMKKMEDDFIFIDFFCHGNASLSLWDQYISEIKRRIGEPLRSVTFRCKERGWHSFLMKISSDTGVYEAEGYEDVFYSLFLSDACTQRDCFSCRFRFGKVCSDVRVGDFWTNRFKNNDTGVSVLSVHSPRGEELVDSALRDGSRFRLETAEFEELRAAKEGPDHGRKPVPAYHGRACRMILSGDAYGAAGYVRRCLTGGRLKRIVRRVLRALKK